LICPTLRNTHDPHLVPARLWQRHREIGGSGSTEPFQEHAGNERSLMMMNGWMGGGMWIWTAIGVLVVVLLVVAINKVSKK
jgi:hypothetical protein